MKWRGPLFQRFLLALVDESRAVRSLAEYLLADTLGSKVAPVTSTIAVSALSSNA